MIKFVISVVITIWTLIDAYKWMRRDWKEFEPKIAFKAILLALVLLFYDQFFGDEPEKSKLINVSVVVEDQKHDLIPAFHKGEDAFVLMTVGGGDTKEEVIDYKGTASFKNVKVGDAVRLKVKFSEPYRPLKDSVYTIPADGRISLTVGLLNLERVYGTVINEKGAFLEGVLVDVNGLRDTTDLTGSYEIFIPNNKQRADQIVKFKKQGYKDTTKTAYPQNKESEDVVMKK